MSVTIQSIEFWGDWPKASDTTFEVRAKSNQSWVSAEGDFVPANVSRVVGTGTITSLRPTIPSIELPSTSAGVDRQDSLWTVTLHRTGKPQVVFTVLDSFPLNIGFEPTATWGEIRLFKQNGDNKIWRDTEGFSRTDALNLINSRLGETLIDASSVVEGNTYLSVDPVGPPIAVGDNDPRLGVSSADYASLSAAVTAIGSTPTTLIITDAFPSGATTTVPSTLRLRFASGGSIVLGSGHVVTIQSPADWPVAQIFSGSGTVKFDGNYALQEVYPEWWGATPGGSASTNSTAILASIHGAFGTNRTNTSGNYVYNRKLKFSGGVYEVDAALDFFNVHGFVIEGETRFGTVIRQTSADTKLINADSISYGVFRNIQFQHSAASDDSNPLIELDYTGSHGPDLKPQLITFYDCGFSGHQVTPPDTEILVRIAKSGGGAQGSNIQFINCNWQYFSFSGLQIGTALSGATNALTVDVKNGDFQVYTKHGIYVVSGEVMADHVSFECVYAKQQVDNGGADFYQQSSSGFSSSMKNIRSEGMVLSSGVPIVTDSQVSGSRGVSTWAATTAYSLSSLVSGVPGSNNTDGRAFICVQAGTTGGTEPTWSSLDIQSSYYDWNRSGAITQGSTSLTVQAALNSRIGQYVVVAGAGAGGGDLITTITAQPDGTHYTLADSASTTVSGALVHIGSAVTDGTVKWIVFDYYAVEGATALNNVQVDFGKISANDGGVLVSPTLSRADWLERSTYTTLATAGKRPIIINPVVRKGYHTQDVITTPLMPAGVEGWNLYSAQSGINLAGNPLLFDTGDNNLMYNSVGIVRGDGAYTASLGTATDLSRNVVGVIGTLGKEAPRDSSGALLSNTAGSDLNIQGGLSTGTGTPGAINFRVGAAGASGATVNNGEAVAGVSANKLSWAYKGADVASAAAITPTGNLFHCTGTTTITSITATGIAAGTEITIIFDGILTFTDGNNLKLAGDFVTSANDTITLKFDGTNFYEICRSAN